MFNFPLKQQVKRVFTKLSSLNPWKRGESGFFRREQSLKAVAGQAEGIPDLDLAIATRIVASYQKAIEKEEQRGDSMWQVFFNERHVPIHTVFKEGKTHEAARILQNPGPTELFYGFDNLMASFQEQVPPNSTNAKGHAKVCLDGLIRFAEAIGAIRLDNPERYHAHALVVWEADRVIKCIEDTLGLPLSFPNPYPDEHGVKTSKGIISYRVCQALYQAWRIKQLLKGVSNPRVLEIGAGLGRTAYYAKQFGINDYTIIDLPFTLISSGYFLARTLGQDQVLLLGEETSNEKQKVKVLSPEAFLKGKETYDLIINVDSLTEMDPSIARAYWTQIESKSAIFLSINQETHALTVRELINASSKVSHADRVPYWMRRGFVEETVWF